MWYIEGRENYNKPTLRREETRYFFVHEDAPEDNKAKKVSTAVRGEAMVYALQSGVYTLAANTFEPYISYQVQKRYAALDPKNADKFGNYSQNLVGELVGDVAGSATLFLAEALCPEPLHYCTRQFRYAVDPIYDYVGRKLVKDDGGKDYEAELKNWKVYQERNLARSLIVASGGIAGNLLAQKYLVDNKSPMKIIFLGKLASSVVSTAIGLTVRAALPKQTQAFDQWIAKKVFTPIINKADGVSHEEAKAMQHEEDAKSLSHAERVKGEQALQDSAVSVGR